MHQDGHLVVVLQRCSRIFRDPCPADPRSNRVERGLRCFLRPRESLSSSVSCQAHARTSSNRVPLHEASVRRTLNAGATILDAAVAEVVLLFREGGLHDVGRSSDDRAARSRRSVAGRRSSARALGSGKKIDVEGRLHVQCRTEQLDENVRLCNLGRIARIDRAVLPALGKHLFARAGLS